MDDNNLDSLNLSMPQISKYTMQKSIEGNTYKLKITALEEEIDTLKKEVYALRCDNTELKEKVLALKQDNEKYHYKNDKAAILIGELKQKDKIRDVSALEEHIVELVKKNKILKLTLEQINELTKNR